MAGYGSKLQPTQCVSTYQTTLLPVFPDTQPMETVTAPPTQTELETAKTLLTMQSIQPAVTDQSDHTTSKAALELQEPTMTMVSQTVELVINIPNVTIENQYSAHLFDAMDKVVNHDDVLFAEPPNWLKFRELYGSDHWPCE